MKCQYENTDCTMVDTSFMTCIDCKDCENYNKGIRKTGSIEIGDNLGCTLVLIIAAICFTFIIIFI